MSTVYFLIILLLIAWQVYLTFLVYRINKDKTSKNVNSALNPDTAVLGRQLNKLDELSTKSISKVKLLRYNPFEEIGGDQSFVLTLLDNHNSGVIITSLHNRGFTRVYAKTIKNGESESSTLSKEEKTAILKAISS
jgi:hypothetical protein